MSFPNDPIGNPEIRMNLALDSHLKHVGMTTSLFHANAISGMIVLFL